MILLGLTWQAWATLGVIVGMLVALVREWGRPDIVMLLCVGVLILLGVLPAEQAFLGFSNSAVIAVGSLFVVAAGVQQTNALGALDRLMFAETRSVPSALARLTVPVAFMSAFLNNTPIVAMLTPRVQQWADRTGIPVSKLMIPLSYATILGGMLTLVGTSTNIVVSGLMGSSGHEGMKMFDLTPVTLPASLVALLFLTLVGYRLLPGRRSQGRVFQDGLQDCLFEVRVAGPSPMIGQTVEAAGLRALGDAYLVHVRRKDHLIPAAPDVELRQGDVLTFTGRMAMLDTLLQRPGLERVVASVASSDLKTLPLFEAVVSHASSMIGKTLREVDFREKYHGVVLAIQRMDEQVSGPLAHVPIKAGDLLIVEAANGFDKQWNERRDEFYLVSSRRPEKAKPQPGKAPIALLILLGIIVTSAFDLVPIEASAFVGALLMILTKCLDLVQARKSVEVDVLIVIAAALGLSKAMSASGLADGLATLLMGAAPGMGPFGTLFLLMVSTAILTEFLSNNAAAALMVPIAMSAADSAGVPALPYGLAVAVAASCCFMTPLGYQTNLMVMTPGGYRFTDYTRAGWPIWLMVIGGSALMIQLLWF